MEDFDIGGVCTILHNVLKQDVCTVCCSMPTFSCTATALLRTGACLGAGKQCGDCVFLPRTAHGHLCQLQVLRKWTTTNGY
jgi:hypothetical protein